MQKRETAIFVFQGVAKW